MRRLGFMATAILATAMFGGDAFAAARRNASDPMSIVQNASSFPRIRESMSFTGIDWESGESVERTRSVSDSEPFLPASRPPFSIEEHRRMSAAASGASPGRALSSVENLKDFESLPAAQKMRIEQNGFVVTGSTRPQMFYFYEENLYKNIPNFITTDIVLHTYSDLFGYLLRRVERRVLFGWLKILSGVMREESYKQYRAARDTEVKAAALENVVYFAVPEAILTRSMRKCPVEAKSRVQYLVGKVIAAEEGKEYGLDFTEFTPRGYYSRSEDWKNYFRAMNWYALKKFTVAPGAAAASDSALNVQLIAAALESGRYRGISAREMWSRIEDLVTTFTGPSNYITARDVTRIMTEEYGTNYRIASLSNRVRRARFNAALSSLPAPRILHEGDDPVQFRFIGKRFVLDTLIMQKLIRWPDRLFASGVDVMAVLDNPFARRLVDPMAGQWDWFAKNYADMTAAARAMPSREWLSGIYPATLWMLAALPTDPNGGYPFFMKNRAWEAKTLTTSLGSWAELRHNTILYAEAFSAEGGGEVLEVPLPKGYVEPNDLFFARMEQVVKLVTFELSSRGCLTARAKQRLDLFAEIVSGCKKIVMKQLRNESRSREEYEFIHFIGGKFSQITTGCLLNDEYFDEYDAEEKWRMLPEGSKNQSAIADVGTTNGQSLEVGIGPAHEIFVAVPTPRGVRLTRGAVYQYYEFLLPAAERLTDEKWKEMLDSNRRPDPPQWISSYFESDTREFSGGLRREYEDFLQYKFEAD